MVLVEEGNLEDGEEDDEGEESTGHGRVWPERV